MDRDHICPRVLEGFRDFDGIFLFLIESCPDLHRDRPVRDLFQFPDDRRRLRNIPHKCRSLMIVHDFRHRTSHIHIQQVERLFPETLKCIHKALRIRSEKLHRDRVLLTAYVDEFQCLFISVTDRIGADHLHGHERRAHFPAENAEGLIRHARHRPEYKGIREGHISDPERFPVNELHLYLSPSQPAGRSLPTPSPSAPRARPGGRRASVSPSAAPFLSAVL